MGHFVFSYILGSKVGYLIWVSDDEDSKKDHFVTNDRGKVLTFSSLDDLKHFENYRGVAVTASSEARTLNLDAIAIWLSEGEEMPECDILLEAWNAFSDVSSSFPEGATPFADMNFAHKPIYEKLFWGSNLPAVTPVAERYDPIWTADEMDSLKSIFGIGLDLFIASTGHRPQEPLPFPDLA
jgi:hypothetical protein